MTTKKSSSKNKSKEAEAQLLHQLFIKPTLILVVAVVIVVVAFYGLVIFPKDRQQRLQQAERYSQHLLAHVNQRLDTFQTLVSNISSQQDLAEIITSEDPQRINARELLISQSFPYALKTRLIPYRQAKLDKNSFPPLSFAGLDMIKKVERDSPLYPEVHIHKQQDSDRKLLNFAAAIKAQEKIVGTLFLSVDFDQFSRGLMNLDPQQGFASLEQSFNRSKLALIETGNPNWKKQASKAPIATNNPNWKISFALPPDQHTLFQLGVFAGLGVVIILTSLACIFFGLRTIDLHLRRDASALIGYGQKILTGYTKLPNFNTVFFESVGHTFERLFSTLPSLLQNNKTSDKGKSEPAQASNSDTSSETMTQDQYGEALNLEESTDNVFTDSSLPTPDVSHSKSIEIPDSIFRAYDIRGIVGTTLNSAMVEQMGKAIATMAKKEGQNSIIVARDGRLSGPELSTALKAGITSVGCGVIDIGMVPTPVLYFACQKLSTQSGVMITGSHNAADYNGLKIMLNGETLFDDRIQEIKSLINSGNYANCQPGEEGQVSDDDVTSQYIEHIAEDVILATAPKIVVDCGNGVAGAVAPQLFTELGCEVIPLYCDVDGHFPNHHPDPSKMDNLKDLVNAVRDSQADLGLAFDGDGDRIGVVTNEGKIIWPDRLMMLYAKDILVRNPGADIIFDVKCSRNLAELISSLGGRPLMWKTGHSLIKNKLKETNAALAGEMSGHIFFNDRWFGFDDGLYSAARLLEIITTELQSCDEIFAELPEDLSTPEIAIPVTDENKFSIIKKLIETGQFGQGKINDLDGLRVDFPKAWGLVRASNTTPTLTARFEAQNPEALQQIQDLFKSQLHAVDSELQLPF